MSREERFQELARKKREEFNEDEEYKRQQTEKYAEKRKSGCRYKRIFDQQTAKRYGVI